MPDQVLFRLVIVASARAGDVRVGRRVDAPSQVPGRLAVDLGIGEDAATPGLVEAGHEICVNCWHPVMLAALAPGRYCFNAIAAIIRKGEGMICCGLRSMRAFAAIAPGEIKRRGGGLVA